MEVSRLERLDVLVIGSGVAGLSAAVRLAELGGARVGVLTKGELEQSTTRWAQGGIAAVLPGDEDSTDLHLADTLRAGVGLCDEAAVRVLVDEGSERVHELIALGAVFDRGPGGRLSRAREGGHSKARVLHAGGTATGAEVERALVEAVCDSAAATLEGWFALDLVLEGGRCTGVVALDPVGQLQRGPRPRTWCLLAGAAATCTPSRPIPSRRPATASRWPCAPGSRLPTWSSSSFTPRRSTTPPCRARSSPRRSVATERCCATAQAVASLTSFSRVTSSVGHRRQAGRGGHRARLAGTRLRSRTSGEGSLRSPSRWRRPGSTRSTTGCRSRLPPITPPGASSSISTERRRCQASGRAGEVACSGVHGANRLASSSLLEGMVFGARCVDAIMSGRDGPEPTGALAGLDPETTRARPEDGGPRPIAVRAVGDCQCGAGDVTEPAGSPAASPQVDSNTAAQRALLQAAMTNWAGCPSATPPLLGSPPNPSAVSWQSWPLARDRAAAELRNLTEVARALLEAATEREETRGSQARPDFPETSPSFACRLSHGTRYGARPGRRGEHGSTVPGA